MIDRLRGRAPGIAFFPMWMRRPGAVHPPPRLRPFAMGAALVGVLLASVLFAVTMTPGGHAMAAPALALGALALQVGWLRRTAWKLLGPRGPLVSALVTLGLGAGTWILARDMAHEAVVSPFAHCGSGTIGVVVVSPAILLAAAGAGMSVCASALGRPCARFDRMLPWLTVAGLTAAAVFLLATWPALQRPEAEEYLVTRSRLVGWIEPVRVQPPSLEPGRAAWDLPEERFDTALEGGTLRRICQGEECRITAISRGRGAGVESRASMIIVRRTTAVAVLENARLGVWLLRSADGRWVGAFDRPTLRPREVSRDDLRGIVRPSRLWYGIALVGLAVAMGLAEGARRIVGGTYRGLVLEEATRNHDGWIRLADGRRARDVSAAPSGPVLVAVDDVGASAYRDDGSAIVRAVLPASREAYNDALRADRLARFAAALAVLAWTVLPVMAMY